MLVNTKLLQEKNLGSQLFGYYLEAGYDLLNSKNTDQKLVPFARYEKYNTHQELKGLRKIWLTIVPM
ncbi:hypothetical protein [uncultured Sunxiuqinia sp.]|uniref:hypothetical protein n=1 Tax=uncultured Sunxiuqinia sp. TaxID=1573825 RepID=UPI002AA6F06C|nr:hypothetical protein [uncultured Sunxiuqinia sp.]